jgi:hypothetical protein
LDFPQTLDYDEWRQVLFVSAQVNNWSNWAIGDCLNYGEEHYGEVFAQAVAEAHISEDKAQICQYMSRRIDPITRRKELSWSHHREVAKATPDEQVHFLDLAYRQNLSVRELRQVIRGSLALPDRPALAQDSDSDESGDKSDAQSPCDACKAGSGEMHVCYSCWSIVAQALGMDAAEIVGTIKLRMGK